MNVRMFKLKTLLLRAWACCTGGDVVYVKNVDNGLIRVKVMRTRFDPFVDEPERQVWIGTHGYLKCHFNGQVSNGGWQWRYVDEDLHVQHKLSN